MSFDAFPFWGFLLAVWACYLLLPWNTGRKALLIAASYLFYATWKPAYVFLLLGVTIGSYCISAAVRDGRRRALMVAGVTGFGGVLAFAKGWLTPMPVGVSFYVLQAIACIVDCWRGHLAGPGGLFDYTLYMSFFPRLTAGPIVRAEEFLPQLSKRAPVTSAMVWEALVLISFGLFKKLVMADNLAAAVDPVFANLHVSGSRLLLATYAFAAQIYCDFSGYSDMAIGVARLFGNQLPINFNWPYLAKDPADFWRRWHISLSNWLRDYIYFSLPGQRAKTRTYAYVNLTITMLVCGLWHGLAWTFALWGIYHGLLLALHHRLPVRRKRGLLSILAMQQAATFGWILFRANRIGDVPVYFAHLADNPFFTGFNSVEWMAIALLIAFGLLHAVEYWRPVTKHLLAAQWNPWVLLLLLFAWSTAAILRIPSQHMFLYFRF